MDTKSLKTIRELKKRLRAIDERDDFVMGVVYSAGNVESWQRLIAFIDNHPDEADYETVLIFSVLMEDIADDEELFAVCQAEIRRLHELRDTNKGKTNGQRK